MLRPTTPTARPHLPLGENAPPGLGACLSIRHSASWKIDKPLLLPPAVQEFVAKDHLARFVLNLVRDDINLLEITSSYDGERGQPREAAGSLRARKPCRAEPASEQTAWPPAFGGSRRKEEATPMTAGSPVADGGAVEVPDSDAKRFLRTGGLVPGTMLPVTGLDPDMLPLRGGSNLDQTSMLDGCIAGHERLIIGALSWSRGDVYF
jgi:hypothetical protein